MLKSFFRKQFFVIFGLAILIGLASYYFYNHGNRENATKPSAPNTTSNNTEGSTSSVITGNESGNLNIKLESELAKLQNANAEANALIEKLRVIKNLRIASVNYTPVLYVLAKLERKMIAGGNITKDLLKLRTFSAFDPVILDQIQSLEGVDLIFGKEKIFDTFPEFARSLKAEKYGNTGKIIDKIREFLSTYFTYIARRNSSINTQIFEAQDAINEHDFYQFAQVIFATETANPKAVKYKKIVSDHMKVQKMIDLIYEDIEDKMIYQ